MSPYITPPSKCAVTTRKDHQEVARSTLVKGVESKMATLIWCVGEWCPSAFNSFELHSWILYQDVQLLWDSGLVRGESGYSL
jgi:hypothetical protein